MVQLNHNWDLKPDISHTVIDGDIVNMHVTPPEQALTFVSQRPDGCIVEYRCLQDMAAISGRQYKQMHSAWREFTLPFPCLLWRRLTGRHKPILSGLGDYWNL